jgi:hypothetical protein
LIPLKPTVGKKPHELFPFGSVFSFFKRDLWFEAVLVFGVAAATVGCEHEIQF